MTHPKGNVPVQTRARRSLRKVIISGVAALRAGVSVPSTSNRQRIEVLRSTPSVDAAALDLSFFFFFRFFFVALAASSDTGSLPRVGGTC